MKTKPVSHYTVIVYHEDGEDLSLTTTTYDDPEDAVMYRHSNPNEDLEIWAAFTDGTIQRVA